MRDACSCDVSKLHIRTELERQSGITLRVLVLYVRLYITNTLLFTLRHFLGKMAVAYVPGSIY